MGLGELFMRLDERNLIRLKYGLFLTSLLAFFYGLFRPMPPPELFNQSDVVGHFLAFIVLCISGYVALPARASYFFFGLLLLFSSIAENLQVLLSPLRVFSLLDTQANMAGAVLGITCCMAYRLYRLRKT